MNPDDVDIDEVARQVFDALEDDKATEDGTRPEPEAALRVIRDEVRGLIAALETDDSLAAPADLIRRTATLLRERGLAAVIAAVLVYDSRRQQMGFRSSMARCHMTFDAEGENIDLHVEPSGDRFRVRGQIGEQRTTAAGSVHFVASDGSEVVAEAPLDSFGCFQADVPAGQYDLQVSTPDCTIVLERVGIG